MRRMLFLYNLHAGKGQARAHLAAMLEQFTRAGWLVTARPTQGKGDAGEIAAELGGEFDRIVCCGGDGTLHEVVCGLMDRSARPEVGYVPAGSTNDFAKNLSLPRSFTQMAAAAAAGVPRKCDIGRFNDTHFIYVAAFGAFTDVAYGTSQQFKILFGHLAYVVEGVARLPGLKSYSLTVEHDGGTLEGDFLYGMVSNTVSVGGFKAVTGYEVALDDGLFEVLLIRTPTKPAQVQSILRVLLQQGSDESGQVVSFRTARLRCTCPEPMPWTLDGEFGGAPQVVEIENCPSALSIVYGK